MKRRSSFGLRPSFRRFERVSRSVLRNELILQFSYVFGLYSIFCFRLFVCGKKRPGNTDDRQTPPTYSVQKFEMTSRNGASTELTAIQTPDLYKKRSNHSIIRREILSKNESAIG